MNERKGEKRGSAPPPRGALEPGTWLLALPASAISGGPHADFAVGDRVTLAMEFVAEATILWERPVTHCEHVQHARYLVSGKCAVAGDDFWVLDFGLRAYHAGPPPAGLKKGDPWTGRVALGVDTFLYAEDLHSRGSVPPLLYRFDVLELWRNAAPFVEVPFPAVGRFKERDREGLRHVAIERTDAENHDGGEAEYLVLLGLAELLPTKPGFVGPG